MSSLYHITSETKLQIRKFRTSTSRTETLKCLCIAIEPKPSYQIVIDEEIQEELDSELEQLSDLSDILPDNIPRFVLMAYPSTSKDGLKQTPLVLMFWKPQTVVSQEWKMLYAGALEMVRSECGTFKLVEVTSGLEDEDDVDELQEQLDSCN
ncbi:Aim7p KNAG_0D01990 [Huiozyma naganishii CBS 8797]|uniref:ADF-H domain-containing protein n=1 Tax=Huiozyma naganishii (strain ATCC MYA-139 / BCRC 22969 / CBS 8797 / KCTC 17520 / NBRC 10181 / NCYC 3082 / Yp74L-3) TaxID=1071383 RepID=J7R534_HUIN7|nr:hypothetical protein KNAG_0D01990 [Kazachstania naganishii CBS 8797]CCK69950.1 hypothetical protein KNAG_0D01990 [Kazachstania naganishii CBS 8797]